MGKQPILPDEHGNYTDKQLEKLERRAMNSSLWFLGKSPQTTQMIIDRLKKKQIPEDIIERTVDKLVEAKWLNDELFAENFIYSKRKYDKLGVSSIRMKLMQKGISRDISDKLLADIEDEDLYDTALILAEKKMRSVRREPDKQKQIQKVAAFLAGRGYSPSIIYDIAKKVVAENAENELDSE